MLMLAGQRFDRLLVIGFADRDRRWRAHWHCLCDCGQVRRVQADHLRSGHTKSCGCLRRENQPSLSHGDSTSPEYKAFTKAKARCTNANDKAFSGYGGRGIEFRFKSFEQFLECLGRRPSANYSVERVDVNGHYAPGNVRWATAAEQAVNKRNNILLTLGGETLVLSQWAKRLGVAAATLRFRYHSGWGDVDILTRPIGKNGVRVGGGR